MIPLRLMILLIGIFILILLLVSNPQEVTLQFLIWKSTYRVNEILLFGLVYGGFLYMLLFSHIKDIFRNYK